MKSNELRTRGIAIVTGASMGIGYELAAGLAHAGYRLVLAARGEDGLRKAAAQIAAAGGEAPQICPVDLSRGDGPQTLYDFAARFASESGGAIEALVNNAGFGSLRPFADDDLEVSSQMVRLNVWSPTVLTRLVLPGMIRRRTGRIMNVASTAAFQPGPYMAVYFAGKSYLLSFSESLSYELRKTGVTVTALCPGPTRTAFLDAAKMDKSGLTAGPNMMTAEAVARIGLRGMFRGKPVVVPGAINKFLAWTPRILPRSWTTHIAGRMTKGSEDFKYAPFGLRRLFTALDFKTRRTMRPTSTTGNAVRLSSDISRIDPR